MTARVSHPLSQAVREAPLVRAATEVCRALRAAGHEASFVGGAVRDLMLAPFVPPTDVDISTSATPAEVTRLFPKSGFVGKSFGVSLVRWQGFAFEVATYRCEGPYGDRRHPDSVREGTQEEDSRRRDFTINALYFDPVAEEVTDFHGGLDHLRAGVLACVGDPRDRLYEDPLRILRLFRFAVATGFAPRADTLEAARAVREGVALLSKERVLAEIAKVKPGRAGAFFASLFDVLSPAELDPALAIGRRDPAACLRFAAFEPAAWSALASFHRAFPGSALATFLRAGSDADADPVADDAVVLAALEAWPLPAADRELMRVLLHVHAACPTAGDGATGSPLSRATHILRLLKHVKEAPLGIFAAAVTLLGGRAPSELLAGLADLASRVRSGAFSAHAEAPLPEVLKRLPPPASLPGRAKLADIHKAAGVPLPLLGALNTLLETFTVLGEACPLPDGPFRLDAPGHETAWLAAARGVPKWRFDGLVARAEGP